MMGEPVQLSFEWGATQYEGAYGKAIKWGTRLLSLKKQEIMSKK